MDPLPSSRDDRVLPPGFLWTQVLGWSALSLVVHSANAGFLSTVLGATAAQIAGRAAVWATVGIVLSTALLWPYRLLFADPSPTVLRIAAMVLCSFGGGLLFYGVLDLVQWPLPADPRPLGRPSWGRAVSPSLALLAWSALLLVVYNVRRWQEERERTLEAEALAVEARLAMLRYELNPHFLFNALNSIVGTIDESPSRAQTMVRQLAELLRHSLHAEGGSTLADEVRTVDLYLALESVRFEDRLVVAVTVPPEAASWPVPAMLLQPLVENAVKHGMPSSPSPLRVEVDAGIVDDRLVVTVANTGHLARTPGQGVGLRNLRDRLVHLYAGDYTFELRQVDDRVVARLTHGRGGR
jgi:two-component system, LytTR family, sensor kinase